MAVLESVQVLQQDQRDEVGKGTHGVVLHCDGGGLPKPPEECTNKQIGNYGEDLAAIFLESCGLLILERNWRCSFGEVDIIAQDDETLVLVEVKTRIACLEDNEIAPEVAVGYRKQAKYRKLALFYLSRHPRFEAVRFDVVAVQLHGENDVIVRHLDGAYEWDD